MAEFPKLKTNAVAQYPASRRVRYQNEALRFLDGREQRYRDSGRPLKQWEIRLSQLDETEMAAVEEFFAGNAGSFGNFAFRDPWDGTLYADCSFVSDCLEVTAEGEMSSAATVMIAENRG